MTLSPDNQRLIETVRGWLELPPEDRVMTLVEDPSFTDWVALILTRLETLERAVLLCQSELDWCIGYASARESDWGVRLTQALRGARALLTSERPAEREERT